MINVSPVGRNASIPERLAFEQYDKEHQIRTKFVEALREKFAHFGLTYAPPSPPSPTHLPPLPYPLPPQDLAQLTLSPFPP